jgi:hypothetical protein
VRAQLGDVERSRLVAPKRPSIPSASSLGALALNSPTAPSTSARSHLRRSTWAQLLRRVFAAGVLTCPHRAGPRRLIAQLIDPIVERTLLAHFGHTTKFPSSAPSRSREQFDFA